MPVVGMGGYFFRAKDPDMLKGWYRDQLGVGGGIGTDETGQSNQYCWFHEGGPMVFSPFEQASDYFPSDRSAMINLRVRDLGGLLEQLRAAGTDIATEELNTEAGSFARIHDPEGNPIELWEPPSPGGPEEK